MVEIGESAFRSCRNLTNITIPDSVTSIGEKAFYGCSSLTSITIPDSVTSIGGSAFYNCVKLTSVTIPDSVTSIGYSAFNGCENLTSIIIPDSVISIGNSAFENTAYYKNSSNWENNVLYIGDHLIDTKVAFTTYTVKAGTKAIAGRAFEYQTNLINITIPDSVTSIGAYAFNDCKNLTSITFEGTVEEWNSIIKEEYWDYSSGSYTVFCANGTVSK